MLQREIARGALRGSAALDRSRSTTGTAASVRLAVHGLAGCGPHTTGDGACQRRTPRELFARGLRELAELDRRYTELLAQSSDRVQRKPRCKSGLAGPFRAWSGPGPIRGAGDSQRYRARLRRSCPRLDRSQTCMCRGLRDHLTLAGFLAVVAEELEHPVMRPVEARREAVERQHHLENYLSGGHVDRDSGMAGKSSAKVVNQGTLTFGSSAGVGAGAIARAATPDPNEDLVKSPWAPSQASRYTADRSGMV
jgi:hypothetical protein